MAFQLESRDALETRLRNRVEAARIRYGAAKVECQRLTQEQRHGLMPSADGGYAVRKALQIESAARLEYCCELRAFTDLLLDRKIPADAAPAGSPLTEQ